MAAQTQANSGHIDNKSYAHPYNKLLDKVIKRTESVPRQGKPYFRTATTNLDTYREAEVSSVLDLPQKNEDTDRIPLLNPVEGGSKTWTNIQYRSGIMVTDRALHAQKHPVIAKMITGLPKSAMRKEEFAYASLFNEGFDTQTTADGAYIFSATHYKDDPEQGTYSNIAATPGGFNTDSFFLAWQHFQNWTNEKGFVDPQPVSRIVYPVALYEDVYKVLNSEKFPQNSLNAKSPWMDAAKPDLYNWLTSSTAWFVCGSEDEVDRGFVIVWQTRPNYKAISDSMNPEMIMGRRLLMRFSVGALHARDKYGNAGA
jgi:hypothetical protein